MLPQDLSAKETAYACFALWSEEGTWEKMLLNGNYDLSFAQVPEPSTWTVVLLGMAVGGWCLRHRVAAWLRLRRAV